LYDLITGPNRADFAQEVAALVMQQLSSGGYLSANTNTTSRHHEDNSNRHDDHNNDNDNDDNEYDDGEDSCSNLVVYREKEKKADKRKWNLFTRGGKMSLVDTPVDLSKKTVSVLWRRWHFSDESATNPVPPWRRLVQSDFIQGSNYRKGKVIIDELLKMLAADRLLPKKAIGQLSPSAADELLDKGVAQLVERYLEKKRELGYSNVKGPANCLSMSFISFYDIVNVKGLTKKEQKKNRNAEVPVDEQ